MEKKFLSKIKLNKFSENELERRAMNTLKGGSKCTCDAGGGASEYWCKAVPVSK